jgi:hypothetical protein
LDTLAGSPAIYGLIEDPINGVLYGTTIDVFFYRDLHELDLQGQVLSTVAVGVAPGNLALDVRSTTAIPKRSAVGMGVYPNPAADVIAISGNVPDGAVHLRILDAMGRVVLDRTMLLRGNGISAGHLTPGCTPCT